MSSTPTGAPVADPQTLNASSGVPLALVLTGTDPDGDILTFHGLPICQIMVL
jgi:hypothetical protein